MRKAIVTTLLFLFLASYAGAEFYRYTDRDGNVRFTDDLGMIPEDQRPGVKEYQAYEAAPASDPAKNTPMSSPDEKGEEGSGTDTDSDAEDSEIDEEGEAEETETAEGEGGKYDFDAMYKGLEKRRDGLTGEYEEMMKQREELAQVPEGEPTSEQIEARNAKVRDFNDKVKAYQTRRDAFEKERDEYNAKAIETMKKTLEEQESREAEELLAE